MKIDGHKEEWVFINKIPGVKPYYQISNFGRIYSSKTQKLMKPIKKANGYLRINLQVEKEYSKYGEKEFSIHRLVALHFLDLPENCDDLNELQVNHKTGNKEINYAWELEWTSGSQNIQHAMKSGLFVHKKGDLSSNHKYNSDLVRTICQALEDGYRGRKLIKHCGLDDSYLNLVRRIRERRHWVEVSIHYNF